MRRLSKQYGLTLVEILVALALSAVLVTALYRIVFANQQGIATTEAYAKMQDTSRTVFDLMQYDLRMAAYRGCIMNLENIEVQLDTNVGYDPYLHDFSESAELIESPANFVSSDNISASAGSSTLVLRKAIPIDALVADYQSNSSVQIVGPSAQLSNLKEGDVMMMSDCETADVFALKSITVNPVSKLAQLTLDQAITGGPSNKEAKLSKHYSVGSQLILMHTIIYFVAPSKLLEGATTGINSLYSFDSLDGNGGVSKELVPYVDKMVIEYLVEEADGKRRYKSSLGAGDNLFAFRVSIEVATEKACGKPKANAESCLEPQEYERVFYVRNSRSEI